MKRFDESDLPDLDMDVLAAFEMFMRQGVPWLDLGRCQKSLVVGSGNDAATGRILLEKADAVFPDESTYEAKLASIRGIDGAILISASRKKHAESIARDLKARGYDRRLLTCNPDAPAATHFERSKVFVYN